MIQFFERNGKLNAVDDQNRLVGFDTNDVCCSHGGWFVADNICKDEPEVKEQPANLDGYRFDEEFFEQVKNGQNEYNAVVFRLIATDEPSKYLHLFNVHNGYYSKGFTASFGNSGLV